MRQVILETQRLVAVMWEPDDAGLIQELHSTIETTRYLSGAAPWSREKAEERLRSWFGEQARDGTTKYKILSRDDGRFVGRAGSRCFAVTGRILSSVTRFGTLNGARATRRRLRTGWRFFWTQLCPAFHRLHAAGQYRITACPNENRHAKPHADGH
ncbi:hypothetical protein BN77_2952 [Rhizobium mesoamericanum STM3625]|uniref:N-acetyltransferase domain-containing protein n=1 Tax=Rhizobium mesoamericanum STM3625 TaxID=1211777 RepID=K0PH16_9HYPH|nr:hypothetical protein BN77_2952 [Rhizobium mesoamericanum STM3625]